MRQPGTILSERYQIETVLGSGGMGAVYLARVPALGNKAVAIKEMRLPTGEGRTPEEAVAQFRREATFLAKLDHPHLVPVTDFFEDAGCHYLVMAYIQGTTLEELVARNGAGLPVDQVLHFAEQLCEVLHYLHTRPTPILFRDLKPSNVMLDARGHIRLIDFGIARFATPGVGTSTFLQGVGSSGYAPLEQYEGQGGTDERSDIYSLGATLFHLLSGQIPPSPILRLTQRQELPALSELNSEVPAAVEALVKEMLAIRPQERPRTVAQVRAKIQRFRTPDVPTMDLGPTPPTVPAPRTRLRAAGWLVAAGLVLVSALTAPTFAPVGTEAEPRKAAVASDPVESVSMEKSPAAEKPKLAPAEKDAEPDQPQDAQVKTVQLTSRPTRNARPTTRTKLSGVLKAGGESASQPKARELKPRPTASVDLRPSYPQARVAGKSEKKRPAGERIKRAVAREVVKTLRKNPRLLQARQP